MSDPFASTIGEKLQRSRSLLLVFGGLFSVFGVALYFAVQVHRVSPIFEEAVVLSFGMESDFDGNTPVIRIRTQTGREQSIRVAKQMLKSCRKGDQILLQRRGLNLRVHLKPATYLLTTYD
ncbi:MAG: hypothetical protein AAF291_13020 [Pseudomonadota bacterium]